MRIQSIKSFYPGIAVAAVLLAGIQPGMAQTGKLVVHANPRQAYIYCDGTPIVESKGHFVCLTEGRHKVDIYNYGFKPEERTVDITAKKTTVLNVAMTAIPGAMSGPWGDITLEGAPRNAVLLNGTEPDIFFVGHGDEFDNEWVWKQELIVPPGKHHLTIMCSCADPWTTEVDVQPNQRVVVDAYKGVRKTVAWHRGEQLKELPRFKAGIASTTVAVEKVNGRLSASTDQVNCGGSAQVSWSSTGAGKVELNGQTVGATGDQTVQPTQNTEYHLTAAGPGGVYTTATAIKVNPDVTASLSVSPTDVRYNSAGEKIEGGNPTLTWSANNATSVSISQLGNVPSSGSRQLELPAPDSSTGATDRNVTYTLIATNNCGGTTSQTATLHVAAPQILQGSANESTLTQQLTFNSIYFPTDFPTAQNPQGGLVQSQEARMDELVANFKLYLHMHPDAKLTLESYADVRGTEPYNKALTDRRAGLVKDYLVSHGIADDRIQLQSNGKRVELSSNQVMDLATQNPDITSSDRQQITHEMRVFIWANNRRVDVRLEPTNELSQRNYPLHSNDVNTLMEAAKPPLTASVSPQP